MKQLATVMILALGCSLGYAADPAQPPKQTRMATCQKEATASGKKGDARKEVLRACMAAGKAGGKNAKAG
ncbi:MAG: PsiF family protein [Ramlibacter sp.]